MKIGHSVLTVKLRKPYTPELFGGTTIVYQIMASKHTSYATVLHLLKQVQKNGWLLDSNFEFFFGLLGLTL